MSSARERRLGLKRPAPHGTLAEQERWYSSMHARRMKREMIEFEDSFSKVVSARMLGRAALAITRLFRTCP